MLNLKSLYWLYTKISSKVSIMQIILIQTAVMFWCSGATRRSVVIYYVSQNLLLYVILPLKELYDKKI